MNDLIEIREVKDEDEAITVEVPLEISDVFGKYWYLVSADGSNTEWGINYFYHNPKFSVITRRMYHLRVLEGLEGSLTTFRISSEREGAHHMSIIAPKSKELDIKNFLHTFNNPMILAVGRQFISPKNVEKGLFTRVKDFYVFDRAKTIWNRKVKEDAVGIMSKTLDSMGKASHGSLRLKKKKIQNKCIPRGIKSISHLTVFDYLIEITKGYALGMSCDKKALVLAPEDGGEVEFNILSYEQDPAWIKLNPGEIVIFSHELVNE